MHPKAPARHDTLPNNHGDCDHTPTITLTPTITSTPTPEATSTPNYTPTATQVIVGVVTRDLFAYSGCYESTNQNGKIPEGGEVTIIAIPQRVFDELNRSVVLVEYKGETRTIIVTSWLQISPSLIHWESHITTTRRRERLHLIPMEENAREMGINIIYPACFSDNTSARAMYEKLGHSGPNKLKKKENLILKTILEQVE